MFGGLYKHGVDTPLTLGGSPEGGVDFQLGYRTGPIIPGTGLAPYAFGALNGKGDTSYAAVGLAWKFGDRFFVRPGLGIAIHNGSDRRFPAHRPHRLRQPHIVRARARRRRADQRVELTLEASWVHMSHATLFGGQNPGIDNIGARLSLQL